LKTIRLNKKKEVLTEQKMISRKTESFTDLHIFLGVIATLIIIGFVFVFSSSSVYALEKFGSSYYFVKKQIIGFIIGLAAFFFIRILPIKLIKFLVPFTFLTTLTLTAMTKLPQFAVRIHGSSRWLKLFGFTFQPSEILKFSLIVYVAYFISKKQAVISSFFKSYLPLLFIIGLTSLVLLSQPDFGLTVTICCTIFILLYVAHFPPQYLLSTLICLIPAGITLIYLKPYRFKRILTFLNPWADPKGSGFQIIQSLIAIGSGSFWGVGVSHSRQKFFYLPMQHTDFIFSIIGEELGLIGVLTVFILYSIILIRGAKIARASDNIFGSMIAAGLTISLALQVIINTGVALGTLPTKGLTLPFLSYGGTSLLINMAAMGILINIGASVKDD
ncbi:MAG: putative lipid II flippase FtsW, partial [Desulfobacteraceae bacterium]|nr:putative lipid II flippase FtsW [Desulfobacteraceae bacterium]